jgi:catalase-peroxidase
MGLIYVNPEGPNGKPDPVAAARDIRETFARMAMNDEETVALIAGGHTFGKAHGAADPASTSAPSPRAPASRSRASAGRTPSAAATASDTITSGLEGAWTTNPIKWDNNYLDNLFGYDWELTKSPAARWQWTPKDGRQGTVPDAHDPGKKHAPMMFTTDLALKFDPAYEKISQALPREPAGVRRRLRPRPGSS